MLGTADRLAPPELGAEKSHAAVATHPERCHVLLKLSNKCTQNWAEESFLLSDRIIACCSSHVLSQLKMECSVWFQLCEQDETKLIGSARSQNGGCLLRGGYNLERAWGSLIEWGWKYVHLNVSGSYTNPTYLEDNQAVHVDKCKLQNLLCMAYLRSSSWLFVALW